MNEFNLHWHVFEQDFEKLQTGSHVVESWKIWQEAHKEKRKKKGI